MTVSRPLDAVLAAVFAVAVILAVSVGGDALFLGLWYYVAVPAVLLGLCAALRAQPLFLCGASLALAITLVSYLSVNWRAARPEGLLGLGHLFSLPGAAAGALVAALLLRRQPSAGHAVALVAGFAGVMGGFFSNQLLVCNTIMWCGTLSFSAR